MEKPRTLFVEPYDDIDTLIPKISSAKTTRIALIVPRNAVIFQSIIALKILRNAAEEAGKEIAIITRDSDGRDFSRQLGIKCAAELEFLDKTSLRVLEKKKEKPSVTLLAEKFNPAKSKFLQHFYRPNTSLLFIIGILSVFLLGMVSYIALPGATIKIRPEEKAISAPINIILLLDEELQNATDSWRQHTLPAVKIESVFEKSLPFETITRRFTGSLAEGKIVLINTLSDPVTLRPKTQFLAENKAVFRLQDWVKIPPQSEVTVHVRSDEMDSLGNMIGARGNLSAGEKLILPKLSSSMQKNIWAEVRTPIENGIDGFSSDISEYDLEIARKQVTEEIVRDAFSDLENFVRRKNKLEQRDLVLVPARIFLETEVLSLEMPENILHSDRSSFEVKSRMRVRAVAFSQGEMLSVLRGALIKSVDPGMELISINRNFFPEFLSLSNGGTRVKISVAATGKQAYIIEPKSVDGISFVNRIKDMIAGKPKNEAKKILENMPEVSESEIVLWPPFLPMIPSLPENISVELLEH